jgi:K+-sensing histidine kinase KdpD
MNQGSHGIGLNICKRFAVILGGDLELNEDVTEGCEFVLKLNLQIAVTESPTDIMERRKTRLLGHSNSGMMIR